MTRESKKLKGRKVDNPMKWMEEDKSHFEIKEELQKFLSENDYILNLVGTENESALLLVAEHFANWNGMQHAKEELTGGERLERLQPSLPSNLEEAAEIGWDSYYNSKKFPSNPCAQSGYKTGFKAGAEWMAGKGVTKEVVIGMATEEISVTVSQQTLDDLDLCPGDKVVVQIRKK